MSKKNKKNKESKESKESKDQKPETVLTKFYGRFEIEKRFLDYFSHIGKGKMRHNQKNEPIIELKNNEFNIQNVLWDDSKIRNYISNLETITNNGIVSRLKLVGKFDDEKKQGFSDDIKQLKNDLYGLLKDQIKGGKIGMSKIKKSLPYLTDDKKSEVKELWNKKTSL